MVTVRPARVEGRLGAWAPCGQGWRIPEVGPLLSLKEGPCGQRTVSRGEGAPREDGSSGMALRVGAKMWFLF